MIIFGSKATSLGAVPVVGSCETCGKQEQQLHVFQRYFHLFWIPTFPLRKKMVLECLHCHKVTVEKDLPPELAMQSKRAKESQRLPVWTFSGVLVFAILYGAGVYLNEVDAKKTLVYKSDPRAGDLVVVRVGNQYGTFEIVNVVDDIVQVRSGNFTYATASGAKREIRNRHRETGYLASETIDLPKASYPGVDIQNIERIAD